MSGNGKCVKAGKLSAVASGPEPAYRAILPYLEAIAGGGASYVGEGELARICKIAHNVMLGVVIQNLAEITILTQKAGVPRHAFLDFINKSVMGSIFTRYKSPALVNLDWTTTFTPALLRKDLDLGLENARTLEVAMPVAAATREALQAHFGIASLQADPEAYLHKDFSALLETVALQAGVTPRERGRRGRQRPRRCGVGGSDARLRIEPRRPLLPQRGEPFAHVGTAEAQKLQRDRVVEGRPHHPQPVVERVLGPADRGRRAGGQPPGDLERPLEQLGLVDRERYQPDPLRLLARDRLAQQKVNLARAMPHSSGQMIAAWSPAATPRRVCPSMIRAVFAAIETSARRPQTSPAPTAGPCMAETRAWSS